MREDKQNYLLDILFILPFFLAMLLQMITISLVWIMVGFGALIMNVKDRIVNIYN